MMLVGTPLVRTEDGAILGPDYRRIPGFVKPGFEVPGVVPASSVEPGDTVRLAGQDLLVLTTRANGVPGHVYVEVRNGQGAEVVHEFRDSERVRVVAVGAFDR
ncbi:MAG: hypothetical protein J0I95_04450 [Microbacterium sp.]|uniref:hypothetical protein n=1 Tax=unclassified Microbacterium TaxID=2609290 RepID=UPI001AC797F6|nr:MULTISPECIES: hypothetical protein [unclassified Microbacterium]MBN9210751.1 hypothetical protein [Microbacterium sp.]